MNIDPKSGDWIRRADEGLKDLRAEFRQRSIDTRPPQDRLFDRTKPPQGPAATEKHGRTRSFVQASVMAGIKTGAAAGVVVALALAGLFHGYVWPSEVAYFVVPRGRVVVDIVGPGILDAINKVTVTTRIGGFLKSIAVERNEPVASGQLIAQLDASDLQNQVAAARAALESANIEILKARSNYAKAAAFLEKATKDFDRKRQLQRTGVASAVEIEGLDIAVRQAQADLDRMTALREQAVAQARSAAAQLKIQEIKRAEADIRSPINGVVISRERSTGDLLVPGAQLFQLVDPGTVFVSTRLDESIMGIIESGQRASIQFTSQTGRPIAAGVSRIGRAVDPETREFMVDVMPDELPKNWAIGQRATVAIRVGLPEGAIVVPQRFVARSNGRAGAWRAVRGRAVWTSLEIGAVRGIYVQVLSGLAPGDVVVDPNGRYSYQAIKLQGSSD